MTKKLHIKKDNHSITLMDEEDIQDKLDEKADTTDLTELAEQIDDIVAGDLDLTTYAKKTDLRTDEIADENTYSNISNVEQTQESINAAIDDKLGALSDIDLVKVVGLTKPTASADTMNKLYLVAESSSITEDNYEIFITVRSGSANNYSYTWEKVDTARVNLSNYIQKSSTTGLVKNDGSIDTQTKVNVAQGSTNANKTLSTDGSGNVITEAKNNHNHNLKDLNIYADGQGGTNLIEGTQYFVGTRANNGVASGMYQSCLCRRVNNTSGTTFLDIIYDIPAGTFKHGEKYTLSFWAKGTGNIFVYNYGNDKYIKTKPINCTSGGTNTTNFSAYHDGNVKFVLTSDWKRYFVTWELNPTSDSTNDASVHKLLVLRTDKNTDAYWAGVMYERGEIPHDWSPSPKDREKFDYRKVKGTDDTSGYIKVLQIQINEGYQDKPITIEIHQRDNIIKNNVSILFQNINSTDPLLKSILHNGDENLLVYLYKENNGIWSLITNKRYGGTYGEMDVKIDNPNTGISISKLDTHIASLPTSTSNNPLSLAKNVNLNTANYIKSTHSSSTSTWTGVSDTITHLIVGTHIYYRLNQAPTTTNVTLNLTLADSSRSTTGAIPVYIGGLRLNNQFPQGSVIGMIYDGNNWLVTNHVPTITPCTVTYANGNTGTINLVTR